MVHLLSAIAESVSDLQLDQNFPRPDPIVIMALDSANAFNTLTREQLEFVLQQGTTHFVNLPGERQEQHKPVGWDILWQHIQVAKAFSSIFMTVKSSKSVANRGSSKVTRWEALFLRWQSIPF